MLNNVLLNCASVLLALNVVLTLVLSARYARGARRNGLPQQTVDDPDLSKQAIQASLHEAASDVLRHGGEMMQAVQTHPRSASWTLSAPDGFDFVALTTAFFDAMKRLELAERASRGEKLSDVELGVVHGVIAPHVLLVEEQRAG